MAEIRQALAQCFKELMQEKSFQKIIVKDITDRANVKRPTFYTYFRDKYDVVEWIFMQEIWQPANSLIAAGYIREGLRFMLISMEKDKRYYRKLAALEGQNSFQEIFVRCIRQEVEQALRENAFHPSYHLLSVELYLGILCTHFLVRDRKVAELCRGGQCTGGDGGIRDPVLRFRGKASRT